MYFSSDSWGKFTTGYLNDDGQFTELESIQSVDFKKALKEFETFLNQPSKRRLQQPEIYKELLEVLESMPIQNPTNPEEMDYVDLAFLEKVKIEPRHVYNFKNNRKERVEFSLLPHPSRENLILFRAKFFNDMVTDIDISVDEFEKILFNIVHKNVDVTKIEHHPFFKEKINFQLHTFIENMKDQEHLISEIDVKQELVQGLGIIHDIKANQDVATFESFDFRVQSSGTSFAFLDDIFFSSRSADEIANEFSRYQFEFYDLEQGLSYYMSPSDDLIIKPADLGSCHFEMVNPDIKVYQWSETEPIFPLIKKAHDSKSLMVNADRNDPFFQEDFERFKNDRMSIIRSSQEQQKKEKIISVFADIEL